MKNDPDMLILSRKTLHQELGHFHDKIMFWKTVAGVALFYAVAITMVYYAAPAL